MLHISNSEAAGLALNGPAPKATTLDPGQQEWAKYVYGDGQSALRMGVWECSPGRFTVKRTTTEICQILSGRATLTAADGTTMELSPGSNFVLPVGWEGQWQVHELIRKIFIVHDPAA
ncbi:cupin domain-containing protein [Phenylobacterium sp.]|jgi:uncharacterized cupin superfamily protein|uniref:cupin domain-containing protein n=1 Tax=Phenylobacterium sp. TaxID=1871053 RepID=UPI003783CEA2